MQHDQDDDEANNDLHSLRKRGKPRGQILIQVERHVGWHSRQMLKNASGGCGRRVGLCFAGLKANGSVIAGSLIARGHGWAVKRACCERVLSERLYEIARGHGWAVKRACCERVLSEPLYEIARGHCQVARRTLIVNG